MTKTLAELAKVPGLTLPDGSPIYVTQTRSAAELAHCSTCGALMTDGQRFGLDESVRFHREATGHRKVSRWRYL